MKPTNFFNNNVKEDSSIIEKASKQKCFKVILTYSNDREIESAIWANNIEEARDKVYFKYIDANKREVVEI